MKMWESIIDNNNETAYPEAHNEWTTWIPPLNFWVLFGLDLWSVNLLDEHIVLSLILHSFNYWCVHLSSVIKYRDRQIFCIYKMGCIGTPMIFQFFKVLVWWPFLVLHPFGVIHFCRKFNIFFIWCCALNNKIFEICQFKLNFVFFIFCFRSFHRNHTFIILLL